MYIPFYYNVYTYSCICAMYEHSFVFVEMCVSLCFFTRNVNITGSVLLMYGIYVLYLSFLLFYYDQSAPPLYVITASVSRFSLISMLVFNAKFIQYMVLRFLCSILYNSPRMLSVYVLSMITHQNITEKYRKT
jgi:hypothetical protein